MSPENQDAKQPNIKRLMIFIGIAVAAFVLYAIVGSLFTGNTPDKEKGIGSVNNTDSSIVMPSDTIAGDTVVR